MLKFFLATLFLLIYKIGFSQQPILQWAKVFTGINSNGSLNNGRTIGVDAQGNVYSAGLFQNTVDFDPNTGVYPLTGYLSPISGTSTGIYVSKLSPTGDFIWAKQIPVLVEFSAIELKVDKNGNVYLTANFNSPTDFDPGVGVFKLTPIGARDAFVIKLDTNGELVWVKQFGGPGDTVPAGSALDIDQNGSVIVCGSFNRTVDFDGGPNTFKLTSGGNFEAYIVKLNSSNGDFIWAKQLGNYSNAYSNNYLTDVKCDATGNIYSTGYFSGNCDFDPGPGSYTLLAGGSADGYVSKLDANGNFVWAKKIGNSVNNTVVQPNGIDIDGNNNIYTTGSYIGKQDFDPGNNVYNLSSNSNSWDSYILKLNVQGDFVWAKSIGASDVDFGVDLTIDKTNNIYAVGNYTGSVDFNPGSTAYQINNLYDETVLSKFDPNGNFIYASVFKSLNHGDNLGRRMVTDDSLNIYITGYTAGITDFDPGPNVYPAGNNSDESPFVLKLAKCKGLTTATLNINACNNYILNNAVFDSTGTYIQVIPNSTGCDSIITLNLTITKKTTEQTIAICEGTTFFAGGTNQHLAGTYKDTLLTVLGCDSIVTTHLVVNAKPSPNLGPDRGLCENTTLTVTPGSFTKYSWQDMSTKNSFEITTTGIFWVTVTNSFNCSATDSISVNAILQNPNNFLQPTDSICSYDKLVLQPVGNFSNYVWSTGETQNKITIAAPGQFWLKVTDAKGCVGTDTTTVFLKDCISGVYVPTAFTPNGDGKNDYFKALVYGKLLSFKLILYDRAGQVVFQTTDPYQQWNGMNNGTPYPTTVFVWQCFYQIENKQPEFQKGTTTLIR